MLMNRKIDEYMRKHIFGTRITIRYCTAMRRHIARYVPAKASSIYPSIEASACGDNMYRYSVQTVDKTATVALPSYFSLLNTNAQIWVCPVGVFGIAYGEISNDMRSISITSSIDGQYNVLVMATRRSARYNEEHMA